MAFKLNAYEADETNVNRLWDLQANRQNHMKKLQTIYKQRQAIKLTSEKDQIRRFKQLSQFHKIKLQDFNHRNKSIQDKINHQNSILRNKILDVHFNGTGTGNLNTSGTAFKVARKSKSLFFNGQQRNEKVSPFKMSQMQQMYQTNLKIGQRLKQVKSQIGSICNIEEHCRQSQKLLQMIQRKSPKKKAYLKSLTKKKMSPNVFLPQISQILSTQYL